MRATGPLDKPLHRTIVTPWRRIVVTLHPAAGAELGPSIELREVRSKESFRITLASLYILLAERAASSEPHLRGKRRTLRGPQKER